MKQSGHIFITLINCNLDPTPRNLAFRHDTSSYVGEIYAKVFEHSMILDIVMLHTKKDRHMNKQRSVAYPPSTTTDKTQ